MKDNIVIERVWQEDYFFEIKITGISNVITAYTKTYTSDEDIDKLANQIKGFVNNYLGGLDDCQDSFSWENGKRGDQSTAYASLGFYCKDRLGHVQIEVYLELNDGGEFSRHNCCFYVETELGLLEAFGKELKNLKEAQIGRKVILNQFYDELKEGQGKGSGKGEVAG